MKYYTSKLRVWEETIQIVPKTVPVNTETNVGVL